MNSDFIKSHGEIELMRKAGHTLANILKELELMVEVGLDVWNLELKFLELCKKNKVIPSCKGYVSGSKSAFPTGLCISINDECVHCYPSKGEILRDGDHVLIDTVISLEGMHVDSAITVPVGNISIDKQKQLSTTKFAMEKAIEAVKDGVRVGDISNIIQTIAETAGYSVLREYTGHGIGRTMHEPPSIPCYGNKGQGEILKAGMTFTIEPLVCAKGNRVVNKVRGGWETVLDDGGSFVQFEHTVLVTKQGVEILTK